MPPKKATTSNGDTVEGPFKWEGPNDNELLLTQGRYVKPDEYELLTTAFPGTTTGSIRNRISALRVRQRNMYDSMGWTLPEGGATKKTPSKKTPTKRDAEDAGVDDTDDAKEAAAKTPSKKPRTRKPKTPEKVKAESEAEKAARVGQEGQGGGSW